MKMFNIGIEDKNELVQFSRYCLEEEMNIAKSIFPISPAFIEKFSVHFGVFVSLYKNKELRACLGQMSSDLPLYKTLKKMTIAAASRDYRFKPINKIELPLLIIEISIISPMQKVEHITEIELGKHGIFVEKDGKTGTFLPQVAENNNWTLEEFLGNCSESKVGIGWDGWKSANVFIYETEVFSDFAE